MTKILGLPLHLFLEMASGGIRDSAGLDCEGNVLLWAMPLAQVDELTFTMDRNIRALTMTSNHKRHGVFSATMSSLIAWTFPIRL